MAKKENNNENEKENEKEKEKEKNSEIEENIKLENNQESKESKGIESFEHDKDTKYSTKTYFRNSGVIQLNQNININIEKNNFENEGKCTELLSPQKNKLAINIKSPECLGNNDNENKKKSPELSSSKNKAINRYQNNSKTIKEDQSEKSNIMKLLQLIKNKKNEREKIDKEKEKAKKEMNKRSKSQSVSRNFDFMHKYNNKSIEQDNENKDKDKDINCEKNININIDKKNDNDNNNDNDNDTNNSNSNYNYNCFEINSPKQEVYNKKNKISNNKYITNYKSKDFNINQKNIKNLEMPKSTPVPSENISKANDGFWSSNENKNPERIVVNHRMKKDINKVNTNNKNNENFKDVIKRYATNADKNRKKENEMEKNIKKTYEKPIFVYNKNNKQNIQNRSMDLDNPDSPNQNQFITNNLSKKATLKKNVNYYYNNNSTKVYNPKKGLMDKGKSVEKFPNNINFNNKITKEYYSNNNNWVYNYNYNNYMSNNNKSNNIYVKKKSFMVESNVDTNTSSNNLSNNLSKSINNQERNKKYYSINNKQEKTRHIINYNSMAPERGTSSRKNNLKINKKSFYLNENNNNQNINNENECAEIIGRSFVFEQNNNEKTNEKYDSYILK